MMHPKFTVILPSNRNYIIRNKVNEIIIQNNVSVTIIMNQTFKMLKIFKKSFEPIHTNTNILLLHEPSHDMDYGS